MSVRATPVLLLLLLVAPARADERVLFVAPGVDAEDAAAVAAALATEQSLDLVDDARARVLLTEQAAALPPDVAAEAASTAIDEAEAAWADLRLDEARGLVERGLAGLLGAPRPPPLPIVARALFVRSLVDDAAGRRAPAARALAAALTLDPSLTPSPARHGPPVLRAVEAARRRGRSAPDAVLRLAVSPAGAIVELDGVATTAAEVPVASGPHLVVARRLGYRPRAVLVEVGSEPDPQLALEPAPAALLAAQVLAELAGGSLSDERARVAARALGLARIFEAVPTAERHVEVRVWSAAGERLATLADPRQPVPSAVEVARRAAPPSRPAPVTSPPPPRSGPPAWLWVGAAAVVVGAVIVGVVLATQGDPEVVPRLTVGGPPAGALAPGSSFPRGP